MSEKELPLKGSIIGFIGLGVMGLPMATHILNKGYSLHVYNRSIEKTKSITDKGAVCHTQISELAKNCDIIITMVGLPSDVEEVYCGENGLLKHVKENSILIDMTTSSPKLATKISEKALTRNIYTLDAPVSGGDIGAKNAGLSIMVGGSKLVYDKILPLFECMGKNIVYQGKAGCGQHTKMANQIVVAGNMIGVCEALAYSIKAGLNPKTVLESIAKGAASSWALSNLAPRILDNDFEAGFYVKHFIKDMRIALECAVENKCETPGLKIVLEQYERLAQAGFENDGTQGLFKMYN
jgi:3-hydroxyisobutyrate dehydrogenase